jgi:hypothetical protein
MQTETRNEASKTNTLVLDREAGELVSPSVDAPIGAGALISALGSQLKKADNAVATEMLGNTKDTIKHTGMGATVHFDNGATYRVEGNTSVGNNHMGEITQKVGTKSMLLVLLMSQNKLTADNITADIIASLVNGEVGAMARVFDIDFDSEKFKEAEKLLKMIEQTTIGEVKGRQQASKVSITQE